MSNSNEHLIQMGIHSMSKEEYWMNECQVRDTELVTLRAELEQAKRWARVWKQASIHQRKGWRMAADIASQVVVKFATHALKRAVVNYDEELKAERDQAQDDAREMAVALEKYADGRSWENWRTNADVRNLPYPIAKNEDWFLRSKNGWEIARTALSEHGTKYLPQGEGK